MAKCDEGYPCAVCGDDVEAITDSDLYLRYIIGEVDPETLHTSRDRHLFCNPILAQFIDDPVVLQRLHQLSPSIPDGFRCEDLDHDFVRARRHLVTRGWHRLQELVGSDTPIVDYPLPEVRAKWSGPD